MADRQIEIQALQGVVTGLAAQSYAHRIQGLVFGAQGFSKLAEKYAEHAEEEMGWVEKFVSRILDLGGEVKIEATPEVAVQDDIVAYLESEKRVSEEGIAQVMQLLPALADDLVATDAMRNYLKDEDEDLQETAQELDLIEAIGRKNWLAQQV